VRTRGEQGRGVDDGWKDGKVRDVTCGGERNAAMGNSDPMG